ncbi:MAG: ABC-F family ATP-binding cassette domain-containing protein [Desulfobulbaceae bacterium]
MAHLLSCNLLSKSFGAQTLFKNISLSISDGDRIGLIGPNGSGKSTLLKIICNKIEADEGKILVQRHVRTAYLAQTDCFDEEKSVAENLQQPLAGLDLDETEQYNRVHSLLSRAEFSDPAVPVRVLSGGWRKRLSICRALVVRPDILVMDEPTNHLDIEGILWLEKMLCNPSPDGPSAVLLVSHDRRFLENTVSRVVELSAVYPEGSFQVQGAYVKFLEERETFLGQQWQQEERLANKVRRETEWLRRGPKARATKARSRIDEAHRLQDELAQIKTRNRSTASVQIGFDATGRKTRKLLETRALGKGHGGRMLFSGLDMVLAPGTKLGLLGRNGCGKSTLMQLLAAAGNGDGGAVIPDCGEIVVADGVRIVSFDQRREKINPALTLRRALAPDGDTVVCQDHSMHVISWAKRFLFQPEQLETPVGQLSGGEQARILIAELMRQPADILLLDEPTNDLDIPSLDVLEESLLEFPGALVLVTHDRFLLDRVCDRVLGFDGRGGIDFFADYEQWLAALEKSGKESEQASASIPPVAVSREKKKKTARLSYLDQREYEQIEERIMEAEEEQERLQALMEAPETVADPERLHACWSELQLAQEAVAQLYERWDELEARKNESE